MTDLNENQQLVSQLESELSDKSLLEVTLLTLLALYILKKLFIKEQDEWALIGRKASDYLKSKGIKQQAGLMKMITYELVKIN